MITLTMKTLTSLPTEKFVKMFNNILKGRYNYRTVDKRLLNFNLGTETQQYVFKEE